MYDYPEHSPARDRAEEVLRRAEQTLREPRDPDVIASAAAAERAHAIREAERNLETCRTLERTAVTTHQPQPQPAQPMPKVYTTKQVDTLLANHVEGIGKALGRVRRDLQSEIEALRSRVSQLETDNASLLGRIQAMAEIGGASLDRKLARLEDLMTTLHGVDVPPVRRFLNG